MKSLLCLSVLLLTAFLAQASTGASSSGIYTAAAPRSLSRHSRRWRRASSSTKTTVAQQSVENKPSTDIDAETVSSSLGDSDSTDATTEAIIPQHVTSFVAECKMPTELGLYKMRSYVYNSPNLKLEPIAMVYGDIQGKENVLVRVHDQCFTSEVFGSLRCDCREQLQDSLQLIQEEGGVVIYLQQEGRGIGIANKIAAYALQDKGFDTVDANNQLGFKDELREYFAVPDILDDLGIKSIRLLTNNPYKIEQLESLGVNINERIAIEVKSNPFNEKYLHSKKTRMNHYLSDHNIASSTITDIRGGYVEKTNTVDYALGKETVLQAIEAIKEGKVVVVVDDADRENEGDLIMAAEKATPETIGFIVRYSSGVLCVSLTGETLDRLALPPMVVNNQDPKQTAYSVSVDCKENTTTGISSFDRATTFRKLTDPSAMVGDFQRPGHVFPLRYKEGGVLARAGHTEASLDLTVLAGLQPGGVLAEVVHDDGSMMRFPALQKFAQEFGLVLTSVQDIKAYRMEMEQGQRK